MFILGTVSHVADDINWGFLVHPLEFGLEGFTYSAVYLNNHPKASLIMKFVDWLMEECNSP